MSANDYYNAGKAQQGGYYPPQGEISPTSLEILLRRRPMLREDLIFQRIATIPSRMFVDKGIEFD